MKGSEAQIKFANDIIAARGQLSIEGVFIGGDLLSGNDGRLPSDEELAALESCVSAVIAFDDASIVIQTKGMSMAEILKRAEKIISLKAQMGIMRKDEFATRIPEAKLMAAAELIRAI